jgi:hypothetical protein
MKRNVIVGCVTAMVLCAGFPFAVQAQCSATGGGDSCNQPGSVTMTAGRVVRLQMSGASTVLTAPTTGDFDAGFNATTGPTFTVSANAPWALQVRAASALWSATSTSSAPARTDKPTTDLLWSTSAGGGFTPVTTADVSLVTGAATANAATTLYFRTLYNWTLDTPGNYSLAIVLTLTAP